MATFQFTWNPSESYDDFLNYTLVPADPLPTDGTCAICRQDFVEEEDEQDEEEEEEDASYEIDYGIMNQAKILAAALAQARENEIPHDIVVRVRNCGHFFHKDCLCSWITRDIAAPLPRRSCPLCKTELIRFGSRARAEAIFWEVGRVARAIRELEALYLYACRIIRELEELQYEVEVVEEQFGHETNNMRTETRDSLLNGLDRYFGGDDNWSDLVYFEQLLLDGYDISESLQIWYTYILGIAKDAFRTRCKYLSAQLEPLNLQLDDLELALRELSKELYEARGMSVPEATAQLIQDFYNIPYAPADEVDNEPEEEPWSPAMTGDDLYYAGVDVEWLRQKALWVKTWFEVLARLAEEEVVEGDDAGGLYTEDEEEEDPYQGEEEGWDQQSVEEGGWDQYEAEEEGLEQYETEDEVDQYQVDQEELDQSYVEEGEVEGEDVYQYPVEEEGDQHQAEEEGRYQHRLEDVYVCSRGRAHTI